MVIDTSEKNPDLALRLNILYEEITLAIYVNVSRGLFERHKLIFSFMLCIDILKQAGEIMESQWNFLLRGPIGSKGDYPKKPDVSTLSENMWAAANYVANTFESFSDLIQDILTVIPITMGNFTQVNIFLYFKTTNIFQIYSKNKPFCSQFTLSTYIHCKKMFTHGFMSHTGKRIT